MDPIEQAKLERLITYATSVGTEPGPKSPWYGVWNIVLQHVVEGHEWLAVLPQHCIYSRLGTYRVPDFEIANIRPQQNDPGHPFRLEPLLILEAKPRNPFRQDSFFAMEDQIEDQVVHLFTSHRSVPQVIVMATVGASWSYIIYSRPPHLPARTRNQSAQQYIDAFPFNEEFASQEYLLGTLESDMALEDIEGWIQELET